MTEPVVLELLAISRDTVWMLTQWWASISLGLIAVARFARAQLNGPVLALIIAVYVLFTVGAYVEHLRLIGSILSGYEVLETIRDQSGLSAMGEYVLTESWWGFIPGITFNLAWYVTFIGTVSFLIYSWKKAK
jgi:hypothetical protein